MIHELIESAPKVPELVWHLVFALLFALIAHQVISALKAMRRMAPALKSALDVTNPVVVFALQFVATLVALGLYRFLETL